MNKEKILKAGKIVSETKKYAREIVRKDVPLIDIANKIEAKIIKLGAKPAFPVNLSINEVAAHYTPRHDDKTLAHGLLKVDFGAHIDGWIADTALSIDLENNEENKKLIQSAEKALENAEKIIEEDVLLNKIGSVIQKTIEADGFSPIVNLSGHSIDKYELHSGITVHNIDNNQDLSLPPGLYAVEPFSTTGNGKVYDGPDSGIYELVNERNVRSPIARELLDFIREEYKTLPFCSRWLVKKFGTKALFGIKQLENNGNLHQFSQLIESSKNKVAQAENTILIEDKGKIITTI